MFVKSRIVFPFVGSCCFGDHYNRDRKRRGRAHDETPPCPPCVAHRSSTTWRPPASPRPEVCSGPCLRPRGIGIRRGLPFPAYPRPCHDNQGCLTSLPIAPLRVVVRGDHKTSKDCNGQENGGQSRVGAPSIPTGHASPDTLQ